MDLDHIGIVVKDIYAMSLFYRKYFGFREVYRYISKNHPGLRTVFLEKDNLQLELLEKPGNNGFIGKFSEPVFHISIRTGDVEAEKKRLSGLGLNNLACPRDTGDGYRELILNDPEGNVIEVAGRVAEKPSYPVKGVIFDLDGTLIDSEDNYFESDRMLMAGFGINFTLDDKKKYIGISAPEMMKDLKDTYGLQDTVGELVKKKNELYIDIAEKKSVVFPEMLKFLNLLKERNFPAAVASGSSGAVVEKLLDILNVRKMFDFVVSSDSVKNGKPAPDVFLRAAEGLGIEPQYLAVVEDSKYGVEAAVRAFMKCIAVPYLQEKPLDENFLMAGLLFENGMKDFTAEKALEWILSAK